MARMRAQEFDTQASLDRKTNEAMKLAKGQAHIRDESEQGTPDPSGAPLVDCESLFLEKLLVLNFQSQWTPTNSTSRTQPPSVVN